MRSGVSTMRWEVSTVRSEVLSDAMMREVVLGTIVGTICHNGEVVLL